MAAGGKDRAASQRTMPRESHRGFMAACSERSRKGPGITATAFKTAAGLGLFFLLAGGIACSPSEQSADAQEAQGDPAQQPMAGDPALRPHLESVPCWFTSSPETPPHGCFRMHVPEDYQQPGGRWISFPLARFGTPTDQQAGTPVLHLGGGGPGAALIGLRDLDIDALLAAYAPLSLWRGHELLVIDPRGSGLAEPNLRCPELLDALPGILDLPDNRQRGEQTGLASAACHRRLVAAGVDPGQYHSRNVSRDIEALRQALQVTSWDLYGVSYASRYALTLIRDFPSTVRSAVLDSPVFPGVNYAERAALDLYQAFALVFERCGRDPICQADHPRAEAEFWEVVERLDAQPVELTTSHPLHGERLPYMLTGEALLSLAFVNLYDGDFAATLPSLVRHLLQGDHAMLEPFTQRWLQFLLDDEFSDGSYNAHFCAEEFPYVDYAWLEASYADLPPTLAAIMRRNHLDNATFCPRHWPVTAAADPYVTQPISSEVPLLVLQGALDPAVNAAYVTAQSPRFPRAQWTIFPDTAHDILGSLPCAARAAGAFFDSGTAYAKVPLQPCPDPRD